MSVKIKHIATFLLGAAAGAAIMKYNNLSEEEKEELMTKLKKQAEDIKGEAEKATETVKEYMSELKSKGMDSLKDYIGETEKAIQDLFKNDKTESSDNATA
ncbi:MAG: hypothetical protein R2831_04765 [Chitinophagaceae bacterium]